MSPGSDAERVCAGGDAYDADAVLRMHEHEVRNVLTQLRAGIHGPVIVQRAEVGRHLQTALIERREQLVEMVEWWQERGQGNPR